MLFQRTADQTHISVTTRVGRGIALFAVATTFLLATSAAQPAHAQLAAAPPGQSTTMLSLLAQPFSCVSKDQPVVFLFNYSLTDVAVTNYGVTPSRVELNPNVLMLINRLDPHAAFFALARQCGYARYQSMNDADADCWAATIGIEQHWLTTGDIGPMEDVLAKQPGGWVNPPGPAQLQHIVDCANAAVAGTPLVHI